MSSGTPEPKERYNMNPELNKMREDVADRGYHLKIKSWIITGISALVGVGIGALFMTTPIGPMALLAGGAVGLMAGGPLAEALTMKDRKKLEIDEDMVNSYMSGKNYWGAGYREEVAEHGYGGEQVAAPRNNLPPRNQPHAGHQPRNQPSGRQ